MGSTGENENPLAKASALEQAVLRQNDVSAMLRLGSLLVYDDHFVSERARGLQMWERAIKQAQNPAAMYKLAAFLLQTTSKEHHRRAFSLLERSLNLVEHPEILMLLGKCYAYGEGVSKNLTVAAQLCERALRLRQDPQTMANLAWTLLQAPECSAQKKRAVALYKKAIHLSSDAAMMNQFALLYHRGTANVSKSPERASKWYMRAIRTSKHPSSMFNLAVLLLQTEATDENVRRAIGLLEDAMEVEKQADEFTVVTLAETYSGYGIDFERALQLYETAAIRFSSREARSRLCGLWIDGMDGNRPDYARIFEFCWKDYTENKDDDALIVYASMMWTGAPQVPMNRKKAIRALCLLRWSGHSFLSLMLRHDLNNYPRGKKSARQLMKKFNDKIDRSNIRDMESILLSENDCASDKLLALESFRAQITAKSSFHEIVWLVPHLRISRRNMPFDGHPDCTTNVMRVFARWKHVASLNLACLLLEIEGRGKEALAVLEDVMQTEIRLIAILNAVHILLHEVNGGIEYRKKGMELLENTVMETSDTSARAMLANVISEGPGSDIYDVERGWKLWRSVEEEEKDEEELRKIRRLISTSSDNKWNALSRQREEEELWLCSSTRTKRVGRPDLQSWS